MFIIYIYREMIWMISGTPMLMKPIKDLTATEPWNHGQ